MTTSETVTSESFFSAPMTAIGLQRRVMGLAAPVIGENMLQTLLMVVDTVLVAGLGTAALAGVGTALQLIYVLLGALSAFGVGSAVLVAQAVGASDTARASHVARQSLLWSLIASLPLGILGALLAEPVVGLFALEPAVQRVAVDYLHVTMATVATLLVMYIGSGILRGVGDGRTPMVITLVANVINVGVTYVLIYGGSGIPALGAVGSAWGTAISRLIGAVLIVWALVYGRSGVRIGGGNWWPDFATLRRVLWVGIPAALEEVLVISGFVALTPVVAALGTTALAANRVVINVLSLSFLPGIGLGLAATSLVGQSVGARDPELAGRITRVACLWAIGWMSVLGAVFFGLDRWVMGFFSTDPALIATGAAAIKVMALTQPFWALTFVLAGALRGTGNTTFPLVVTGVAIWAAVGLAALLLRFEPQLWVVWAAFVIIGPIESLVYYWGFRRWLRGQARG